MTRNTLAPLTTLGVGGPAQRMITAGTEQELIDAVRAADEAGEKLLVIGGGSNLVISDAGFDGTVVRIASSGFTIDEDVVGCGVVTVTAQAGQPWDELVQETVRREASGLEALSGIPGLTGATPVQNVGAYGSDVSQTISMVRVWDRKSSAVKSFANSELGFAYRDSVLKRTTVEGSPRYVVLTVEFQLQPGHLSAPVKYAELARAVGVNIGRRAVSVDVRREVLRLRGTKGMVLDPHDRDTFSTGSFFTNPIVPLAVAERLPADAPRFPVESAADMPNGDIPVKLSAAWLIDHAGFGKGYGLNPQDNAFVHAGGRASLSTKHTLAVTNRGGASAADVLAVASAVADGVEAAYGIRLHAEPLLIGCSL